MDTIETWWKDQKTWWRKARRKASSKTKSGFEAVFSIFDSNLFSSSTTAAADAAPETGVQSSSPLKTFFGYGAHEPEPAVKRKPSPALNKTDIAAALVTYFPDAAIVVLCRQDGTICTSENYAAGGIPQDELRNLVRAVNVGVTAEARDKAIVDGLIFAGKRFEVFQFHPPLVYGRTAAPKQSIKDGWGIAVVRHEVSGDHTCIIEEGDAGAEDESRTAYLIVAYPLPNTSAYILSQAKLFCRKFL